MKDNMGFNEVQCAPAFQELFKQLFPEVKFVDCMPDPDEEESDEGEE